MENLNNDSEQSEENEISTKPQTEQILITQTKEINTQPEKTKKKKRHKKKKTPKKVKKEELTEEEINKFRLQDKTIAPSFISYYKNLLGFDESEYSSFLKASVEELPIIFRINKIYTYYYLENKSYYIQKLNYMNIFRISLN
mgnify:CR=1 FL=1